MLGVFMPVVDLLMQGDCLSVLFVGSKKMMECKCLVFKNKCMASVSQVLF